jgi:hypothetical protein
MADITLAAIDGRLHFPRGGDDLEEHPSILMRIYDAGDMDTVPWPLECQFSTREELEDRLASALYDERECNRFFPTDASIRLPDGTAFDFDAVLARRRVRPRESPDYDPTQSPR